MKNNVLIAPSLLSSDFARLKEEIEKIEKAGADLIHLDIMDGHFVPNLTFGPYGVSCIKKYAKKPLDVHLMLDNPDELISSFAKAGADMISVHCEACRHIQRTLDEIKRHNVKAGIAINPATPFEDIMFSLNYADFVLVMTVNPGFGGQKFLMPVVEKIARISQNIKSNKLRCDIEVDGGIDFDTAKICIKNGVKILVSGNTIFKNDDYKSAITKLRQK